ncbi:MAG: hypothetical protein Q9169_004150 [Polycauliona sp. 2 TL-2023]
MADIFGAIGLAAHITKQLYLIQKDAKVAVQDRDGWIAETDSIERYLQSLKERLENLDTKTAAPFPRHFIEAMGLDYATLISGTALKDLHSRPNSPLGQLQKKLIALDSELESNGNSKLDPNSKIDRFRSWYHGVTIKASHHFNKADISNTLWEISRVKDTFVQAIQLDDSNQIEVVISEQTRQRSEADKQKALGTLSKLDFADRQNKIYSSCYKDDVAPPGQWFLTSQEFLSWREGRPWPLYCIGQPGAGKTVLSSIVIRHLQQYCRAQGDSNGFAVLYVYLDHKETKSQSYSAIIRSILRQLLLAQDIASPEALRFIKDCQKGIIPSDDDVIELLQAIVSSSSMSRVYLIIDALDEFREEDRPKLLAKLTSISLKKLSLLITTRPSEEVKKSTVQCMSCPGYLNIYFYCPVCPKFDLCQECKNKNKSCRWRHELREPDEVVLEVVAPDSEIERFVKHTLDEQLGTTGGRLTSNHTGNSTIGSSRMAKLFRTDPKRAAELRSEIMEKVVSTAQGMFLLAKLHIDSLKLQTSLAAITRALQDLSPQVSQIYATILTRIQDQSKSDRDLAMQALSWVTFAHRPLNTQELIQAIAMELLEGDFDVEEETHFDIIMRVTMGLISADSEKGAVRLVHRTAQEYFEKNWKTLFPERKSNITQKTLKCLTKNLSSPCTGPQEDQELNKRLSDHPFLAYAATYWGEHVQDMIDDSRTLSAVLDFLKNSSTLSASIQAAWYAGSKSQNNDAWDVRKGVNAVHVCAWYGLTSCITELLVQSPDLDIDSQDHQLGQTPLMYACSRGHVSTVTELLKLGANVNMVNAKGCTAAFLALSKDHPDVFGAMMKQQDVSSRLDLNAVIQEDRKRTVLMVAALKGYQQLISEVLRHPEVDKHSKDSKGYTALALAATMSEVAIVETLLDLSDVDSSDVDVSDVDVSDVNEPNDIGSTPLIIAAEGGKADMVRAMLKQHADWRLPNLDGDTALSKAIIHGHTDVVKALIDHGAYHRVTNESKRTVLHVACSTDKAKPDIIELLLKEGFAVNALGDRGDTALHNASRVGSSDVAKILLSHHADQTIKDKEGRTPLVVAWQNGHSHIIKLLQEHATRNDMTLDTLPEDSKLPLWSLAKLRHNNLLIDALQTRSTELEHEDPDTQFTALHWAIHSNELDIARALLTAGAKTSATDDHTRTPLHIAAYLSNYEATDLLLEFNADPFVRNSWDMTPYWIALSKNAYALAVLLLKAMVGRSTEVGAVIEEGSREDTQACFYKAVGQGEVDVVKLLGGYGVDFEGRDGEGRTVLELAEGSGDDEVLGLLQGRLYQGNGCESTN